MLDRLKSYWSYGTKYCAVEYTSNADDDVLHAIKATYKKGEFNAVEEFSAKSVDALAKELAKKTTLLPFYKY